MMWFFAILVVLVMGGVAAVAAGRGAPMSEAYDDRPDALVPSGRPLAAGDLRRVRFPLAFRGYRMGEVDALLDRLAAQLEHDDPVAQPVAHPLDHDETGLVDDAGADHVPEAPAAPEPRGEEPPN